MFAFSLETSTLEITRTVNCFSQKHKFKTNYSKLKDYSIDDHDKKIWFPSLCWWLCFLWSWRLQLRKRKTQPYQNTGDYLLITWLSFMNWLNLTSKAWIRPGLSQITKLRSMRFICSCTYRLRCHIQISRFLNLSNYQNLINLVFNLGYIFKWT